MSNNKLICIGTIVAAHGVRGEVKIKPYTEDAGDIDSYGPVYNKDRSKCFNIKVRSVGSKTVIAGIEGIKNRDDAEKLKGTDIYIYREVLPNLDNDEFYYEDIIGMEVRDENGNHFGVVEGVSNYGASDIIEILPNNTNSRCLIEFTHETVPEVNMQDGYIVISLPDLIDIDLEDLEDDLFILKEPDNDNNKA